MGWDELFFNLNNTDWGADSGFAQNRFFGGVGWKFDTKGRIKAEAGYLNQFIDKMSGDDTMNHIFFVTLFLNFWVGRSETKLTGEDVGSDTRVENARLPDVTFNLARFNVMASNLHFLDRIDNHNI